MYETYFYIFKLIKKASKLNNHTLRPSSVFTLSIYYYETFKGFNIILEIVIILDLKWYQY